MALAVRFTWTLLPESWCHLVVTICTYLHFTNIPTDSSAIAGPVNVFQSAPPFSKAEQLHHFSKSHSHLEESFLQKLPNKVKGKLCITSTQLEDNLLGKGQATVTLRDSSQQQIQLWICFLFKSNFQYRSCISGNVPFAYIVIMLKNPSNRYKRKKGSHFNF